MQPREKDSLNVMVPLTINGVIGIVHLTQGFRAIVDTADLPLVMQHRWQVKPHGVTHYARATLSGGKGVYMHILLLGKAPSGFEIDHQHGNGLDNRRCKLRISTVSQNRANSRKRLSTSSRHKGVTWHSEMRKWRAYIAGNHIGYFHIEDEAARAYDGEALRRYGEFAKLNFPATACA